MIYPMFAMVLLTFILGGITVYTRVKHVNAGNVRLRSFLLMDGDFPKAIVKTTRSFNNQFELPILFYVALLLCIAMQLPTDIVLIVLAWAFVLLRYIHAFVHITLNHLLARLLIFWLGFFVLMALWLKVFLLIHAMS